MLVFIIVFIQKRPQGLFALKGRMAETDERLSSVRDMNAPLPLPLRVPVKAPAHPLLTRPGWIAYVVVAYVVLVLIPLLEPACCRPDIRSTCPTTS